MYVYHVFINMCIYNIVNKSIRTWLASLRKLLHCIHTYLKAHPSTFSNDKPPDWTLHAGHLSKNSRWHHTYRPTIIALELHTLRYFKVTKDNYASEIDERCPLTSMIYPVRLVIFNNYIELPCGRSHEQRYQY